MNNVNLQCCYFNEQPLICVIMDQTGGKMTQIFCTVSEPTIHKLTRFSKKERKSFSRFTSEMVELGLKIYAHGEADDNASNSSNELEKKSIKASLMSLEILHTLLKLHFENFKNAKEVTGSASAEKALAKIKSGIDKYIDGLLTKP